MDYSINVFGLILVLGIIALIVVAVMYFYQKKKVSRSVKPAMVETDTEVIEKVDKFPEVNIDSLRAYLSPYRNDQPFFMHEVSNFLECVKSKSEIKVLRAVLAQLEVKSELLSKIDDFEENLHTLKRKEENFKQRDKLQDLNYDKERRRILNEIENLVDEAGGIEKARERELNNYESELTHKYALKSIENKLADIADREKNAKKTTQFNDMNNVFRIQHKAIKDDQTLTPAVKKETLRTLEQTFVAQLDEFKRGL